MGRDHSCDGCGNGGLNNNDPCVCGPGPYCVDCRGSDTPCAECAASDRPIPVPWSIVEELVEQDLIAEALDPPPPPTRSLDFRKHDTDKPRLDLIPRAALEAAGRALGNGAAKYGANNWRTCKEPERYVAATLRHIVAWNEGEATDPESGLSHLDHAAASLAILIGLVTQPEKP